MKTAITRTTKVTTQSSPMKVKVVSTNMLIPINADQKPGFIF